jgi:hypothetical protein
MRVRNASTASTGDRARLLMRAAISVAGMKHRSSDIPLSPSPL